MHKFLLLVQTPAAKTCSHTKNHTGVWNQQLGCLELLGCLEFTSGMYRPGDFTFRRNLDPSLHHMFCDHDDARSSMCGAWRSKLEALVMISNLKRVLAVRHPLPVLREPLSIRGSCVQLRCWRCKAMPHFRDEGFQVGGQEGRRNYVSRIAQFPNRTDQRR